MKNNLVKVENETNIYKKNYMFKKNDNKIRKIIKEEKNIKFRINVFPVSLKFRITNSIVIKDNARENDYKNNF